MAPKKDLRGRSFFGARLSAQTHFSTAFAITRPYLCTFTNTEALMWTAALTSSVANAQFPVANEVDHSGEAIISLGLGAGMYAGFVLILAALFLTVLFLTPLLIGWIRHWDGGSRA
jgi:hypothetical protein